MLIPALTSKHYIFSNYPVPLTIVMGEGATEPHIVYFQAQRENARIVILFTLYE